MVVTSARIDGELWSGVDESVMDESVRFDVVPSSRDDLVTALFASDFERLVGLARQLVDQRAEAEEIVQEAFVRLYVAFGRLHAPERAAAYLRVTTLNLCRSRLRRRRLARRRPDVATEVPVAGVDEAVAATPDVIAVRAAVARLPKRQQDCVLLRYYAGCSDAEIASTLGIALGTVKTSLHRARHQLARRLEGLR